MLKNLVLCCMMLSIAFAEPPIQGVKPTNLLGSSDQHASFSFVRPGLTQTAFAFAGPSSHQSFSSSVGNPHLAQRVLPNLANALAYRNPGLGVFPVGPVANGYATAPVAPAYVSPGPAPLPYQTPIDPATLAYYQQLQQVQQPQVPSYSAAALYQAQLAQLLALRQAQAQSQAQVQATQTQQVPEQVQLQQEEQQQQQQQQQEQQQSQNLLGIAYSSAPSVARVKVTGNGYKFDF